MTNKAKKAMERKLVGRHAPKQAVLDNPFERRQHRKKFSVLGRTLKGAETKTGQSRSKANEQRVNSLLVEYLQKGKDNTFVDRRIGEKDEGLTQEEKMLARFQREQQKKLTKRSMYNLEEGGGEDDTLTHMGQSLGDPSFRFDDYMPSDDDGSDGEIGEATVSHDHFGGFELKGSGGAAAAEDDGEARKKTKREVMEEVVKKSKLFRAKEQLEKMQREELTQKLDSDLKDIRGLLSGRPTRADGAPKDAKPREELDEFDMAVRELRFEARGQARDRLKTEEEVAREEKERLQKLEKARQRRLNMISPEEDDEEFDTQDAVEEMPSSDIVSSNRNFFRTGGEAYARSVEKKKMKKTKRANKSANTQGGEEGADTTEDIPYTFTMPADFDALHALLAPHASTASLDTVLTRLRACHHISLHPNNKTKLEHLLALLFEYFGFLAAQATTARHAQRLGVLTRHIFALEQAAPDSATAIARHILSAMEAAFVERCRTGAATPPPRRELLFLRLFSALFPTSDFQHPVVTPALIFMGHCLSNALFDTLDDVMAGLFLCTLCLEYIRETARFIPECAAFLTACVARMAPASTDATAALPPVFSRISLDLTHSDAASDLPEHGAKGKADGGKKGGKGTPVQWVPVDYPFSVPKEEPDSQDILQASALSLKLLCRFAELHRGLSAFPEIFGSATARLIALAKSTPEKLRLHITAALDCIYPIYDSMVRHRKPLALIEKAPACIAQFTPRFEDNFLLNKDYDIDAERAEKRKLKRKYKSELKGAMRELRKDTQFLQDRKNKEKEEARAEKEEKFREALSFMEAAQASAREEKRLLKTRKPRLG